MSSAVVISYRENWMGYHGAETEESALVLAQSSKFYDPKRVNKNDYAHRQRVVADVKERLYLIKKELDLIPAEELAAQRAIQQQWEEDQARRRHRHLMRCIQELEEEEINQRQRITCEMEGHASETLYAIREATDALHEQIRCDEEERRRIAAAQEAANNIPRVNSEEDSSVSGFSKQQKFDEETAILQSTSRDEAELDNAVSTLSRGVRMLLYATNNCYISYLDGSRHTTVYKLDEYNSAHLEEVNRQVQIINHTDSEKIENITTSSTNAIPEVIDLDHDSFETSKFHQYVEMYTSLRIQLEATRAQHSASHSSEEYNSTLFASERQRASVINVSRSEEELVSELKSTMAEFGQYREKYNARATQSAIKIANTLAKFASKLAANSAIPELE